MAKQKTAKEELREIYSFDDFKSIFLNSYKDSGCDQHNAMTNQTTNVPFYNKHEDEILDYFEDEHKGNEPVIEQIMRIASHDIIMVKSIAVQYFIEMFACEVVGIPYSGEMDQRQQRKKLRELGVFDYKGGMMTPQPPDFKRKKGSAHNTTWTETNILPSND